MVTIALSEIKPWADNYNEGDIGAISLSIRRFGYNGAVSIWKRNECRAGNHTVMALRMIKAEGPNPQYDLMWPPKHVEVDKAGEWHIVYVDIRHLDEKQALAFAIADNRLARRASVDEAMLAKYLRTFEETDLMATGYDEDDIARMVAYTEEDVEAAKPWVNPTDALDIFQQNPIKSIVLYFPADEYVGIVDRMGRLRAELDLESNTDLFLHLMEAFEHEHPATVPEGN